MVIRALRGGPPERILKFFRSKDEAKSPKEFWAQLRSWYQDPSDKTWLARWSGFVFPGDSASTGYQFHAARFTDQEKANFSNVTFTDDVSFSLARFGGEADFTKAVFAGGADFSRASFQIAVFEDATFERFATFEKATFLGLSVFNDAIATESELTNFTEATFCSESYFSRAKFDRLHFSWANFLTKAVFVDAIFSGHVDFTGANFEGEADFTRAIVRRDMNLARVCVDEQCGSITLGIAFENAGRLTMSGVGCRRSAREADPVGPARVHFGSMSLSPVELSSLDGRRLRFRNARDIERMGVYEASWPVYEDSWLQRASGYRVADDDDLKTQDDRAANDDAAALCPGSWRSDSTPSWEEVERIYRSLRKNYEDRNDRVGAHKWYFAEMEIGRRYPRPTKLRSQAESSTPYGGLGRLRRLSRRLAARYPLRRVSRNFYRWTSNYGLSAILPTGLLLCICLLAFAVFMIPSSAVCPWRESVPPGTGGCVGARDAAKVVVLSVFFQPVPLGISFVGLIGQLVWLLTRLFGAAMLLSIGVAFRNQVAR